MSLSLLETTGPAWRIREGSVEDAEEMWRLDRRCFSPRTAYPLPIFEDLLETESIFSFVAETVGQAHGIAGFVIAEIEEGDTRLGHVITLDVSQEARRTGLGSEFLNRAYQRMVEAGANFCLLEVDVRNEGAIAFYRRHGFIVMELLKNYYGQRRNGYLMIKELNGASSGHQQ